MFDKFFTIRKGESKKVLTANYGEVAQFTVMGKVENKDHPDKVFYSIGIINNNVPETAKWFTEYVDQLVKLEIKDGESLTIQCDYDEVDFHINGEIYQVV